MGISELGNHHPVAPARQRRGRGFGLALAAALSVTLALLPAAAWAGPCDKARMKTPCVNGTDVKDKKLTALDVFDEPAASFNRGPDSTIVSQSKAFATITTGPLPKFTIFANVTFSAGIGLAPSDPGGSVSCFVRGRGGAAELQDITPISSVSVDSRRRPLTSIGGTSRFAINKVIKDVEFKLMCRKVAGGNVRIFGPRLTAIFD